MQKTQQDLHILKIYTSLFPSSFSKIHFYSDFLFPGLVSSSEEYWIGLTNPRSIVCTGPSCSGKLRWPDGSDFTHEGWMGANWPDFSEGKTCLGYSRDNNYDGHDCEDDNDAVVLCQFDCIGHGSYMKQYHCTSSVCPRSVIGSST